MRQKTALSRLLSKILQNNNCWIFQGQCNKYGYGLFWFEGKSQRAHRISYFLHKGKIPNGLIVCHSCDNPPCINPDHLFLGTRLHNNQDAVHKQRHAFGEKNGKAKITEEIAHAIKYADGKQYEIAKRFGVTQPVVSKIKKGTRWKHL